MGAAILVVDDDDLLRRSLAFSLEQSGFDVHTAASAEDGIAICAQKRPDLILLDVMLPGMDGLEALRYFRDKLGIPVIFLTARRREMDQILGLELGADDYITKPLATDVVIARIRAVLRRTRVVQPAAEVRPSPIRTAGLVIDPWSRTVTRGDQPIQMTPKEFDLLYAMALEPGHVLSVEDILARVWGAEYQGQPEVVYVNMRWLRQKIEKDPRHPQILITVRGAGYKLVEHGGGA